MRTHRACARLFPALLRRLRSGYVNYDPTAGQAMSDIPNVGSRLPLRAVLFDYSVLSQVHDYDAEAEGRSTLKRGGPPAVAM